MRYSVQIKRGGLYDKHERDKSKKNLFEYLNSAIEFNDIISVNTKRGNAVILSEDEYNGLLETLELCSVPGMKERLQGGLTASASECVNFKW